jgi:hypothetical protein
MKNYLTATTQRLFLRNMACRVIMWINTAAQKLLAVCELDWISLKDVFNSHQVVARDANMEFQMLACLVQCLVVSNSIYLNSMETRKRDISRRTTVRKRERENKDLEPELLYHVTLPCCGQFVRKFDASKRYCNCREAYSPNYVKLKHAGKILLLKHSIMLCSEKIRYLKTILSVLSILEENVPSTVCFCKSAALDQEPLLLVHLAPQQSVDIIIDDLKGLSCGPLCSFEHLLPFCIKFARQCHFDLLRTTLEMNDLILQYRFVLVLPLGKQDLRCTALQTLVSADCETFGFVGKRRWILISEQNETRNVEYKIRHSDGCYNIDVYTLGGSEEFSGQLLLHICQSTEEFTAFIEQMTEKRNQQTYDAIFVVRSQLTADCFKLVCEYTHGDIVTIADFAIQTLLQAKICLGTG